MTGIECGLIFQETDLSRTVYRYSSDISLEPPPPKKTAHMHSEAHVGAGTGRKRLVTSVVAANDLVAALINADVGHVPVTPSVQFLDLFLLDLGHLVVIKLVPGSVGFLDPRHVMTPLCGPPLQK